MKVTWRQWEGRTAGERPKVRTLGVTPKGNPLVSSGSSWCGGGALVGLTLKTDGDADYTHRAPALELSLDLEAAEALSDQLLGAIYRAKVGQSFYQGRKVPLEDYLVGDRVAVNSSGHLATGEVVSTLGLVIQVRLDETPSGWGGWRDKQAEIRWSENIRKVVAL